MNRLVFALVVVGAGAAWADPVDENWLQWRGPYNTGMAATDAPLEFSATENVVWKAEIPGRGLALFRGGHLSLHDPRRWSACPSALSRRSRGGR